ncbi:glycosyltransferase family 2 protein [Luteimonas sp. MJ204]|uniref:glycosyltransferase family 2 protein n=1 Tax=Luteimonas sp. MJ145 TaxID=3129234 RepID=UPI0031BA3711
MTATLPPVSIGIPFFNAELFLLDAIKSVFAQTHEDWELILMDDGSTDRSLEIARSIDDPRVRVFSDGKNKKLAARLNEITLLAKFDYVARMDADDLMATDRIRAQLAYLVEKPEIDLVTTGVCSITDESVPYGIRTVEPNHHLTPYRTLGGGHGIVHAAVAGRKAWFLRNPYDPADHWAEDYKLWVRACRANDLSVGFIKDPLYFYREEGSASVAKMLAAQKVGRMVVSANGLAMVGVVRTSYLLTRSFTKTLLIRIASVLGVTGYIVKRRSPSRDDRVFELVAVDIDRIELAKV